MSGNPAKRTQRTWLTMAGAFIGATIALIVNVTVSWGDGSLESDKSELSPTHMAALHADPGTCLNWAKTDASDMHKLPCEQPHKYEVTSVENIADEVPNGAPSPDVDRWKEIAEQRCTGGAEASLGKPLDPYGRFTVSGMRPAEESWQKGERELRCVLQWPGPGGGLQQSTGPAAVQQQAPVWPDGTCLGLSGNSVGDPVDCTKPHSYEIVGNRDLAEKFTDGYPSQDEQKEWLDTECTDAAKEYSGGADPAEKGLIVTWDLREQESWNTGSSQVNCKVGATLPDNSGLAPVEGSVRTQAEAPAPQPGGK